MRKIHYLYPQIIKLKYHEKVNSDFIIMYVYKPAYSAGRIPSNQRRSDEVAENKNICRS